MTKTEWMNAAADSFYNLLELGFSLYGTREDAIDYASKKSCAGEVAREIALDRFNQTIKA